MLMMPHNSSAGPRLPIHGVHHTASLLAFSHTWALANLRAFAQAVPPTWKSFPVFQMVDSLFRAPRAPSLEKHPHTLTFYLLCIS